MDANPNGWREELKATLERVFSPFSGHLMSALEAGGGSATFLNQIDQRFCFTTIDISPEQLRRNTYADVKILGDLEEFEYGAASFDAIICWDVLEHLERPQRALKRLLSALGQGGVVIIKGPIPQSMKGLVTQFTPHWCHVLFYRLVLGYKNAGRPGYAPFPTHHKQGVRPEALRDFLIEAGLQVETFLKFESNHIEKLKRKGRWPFAAFSGAASLIRAISGGRYGQMASEFVLVVRRTTD